MNSTGRPTIGSRTRWLISETLVVVLGVLIALGLNDYWTNRQERGLELQALDAIAPIVRGEVPVPEDEESFLRNVVTAGHGGTSATRWVTSTTIEDLKSTGNLRLIRDVDLRRNIARYYHDMERLYIRSRDRRTGYTAFVFSQLPVNLKNYIQQLGGSL